MSRRDDRDRSRTRRRRDRSPSPQAHKARRREHNDNQVSENMDWNNLVSWQHNSGYNAANNFPMMPTNFSNDSQSHTTIPIPSDQLHDADPSRPHAIQVHDTSDATTGYYFPTYTYTWTTCSSTGSSSESLAYSIA